MDTTITGLISDAVKSVAYGPTAVVEKQAGGIRILKQAKALAESAESRIEQERLKKEYDKAIAEGKKISEEEEMSTEEFRRRVREKYMNSRLEQEKKSSKEREEGLKVQKEILKALEKGNKDREEGNKKKSGQTIINNHSESKSYTTGKSSLRDNVGQEPK